MTCFRNVMTGALRYVAIGAMLVPLYTGSPAFAQFHFATYRTISELDRPRVFVVADVDGDGRLEPVVADQSRTVSVYRRLGESLFQIDQAILNDDAVDLISLDLDQDQDQDIVVAYQDKIAVLLSVGEGILLPLTQYHVGGFLHLVAGDFDRDGKTDVGASSGRSVHVFRSLGDGLLEPFAEFDSGFTVYGLAALDLDDDGNLDLLLQHRTDDLISPWLGGRQGDFVSATPLTVEDPRAFVVGDFNTDGLHDLAVASADANVITVYVGQGSGDFTALEILTLDSPPTHLIAGDITQDGALDLVGWSFFFGAGPPKIWKGLGDGTFEDEGFVDTSHKIEVAEIIDLDDDSLLDFLYVATNNSVFIWQRWTPEGPPRGPTIVETGVGITQIDLADVNNDSDPNVAAVERISDQIEVFEIDGAGGLELMETIALPFTPRQARFFDANADGRLDLLVSAEDGTVRALLRDGSAFVEVSAVAVDDHPGVPEIGDFNGDGNLDAAVPMNHAGLLAIVLNDGAGQMASTLFGTSRDAVGVALVDFNHDSHLDVLVSTDQTNRISLLAGDGTGSVSLDSVLEAGEEPQVILAADLNSDGDSDVAVANLESNTIRVHLAVGNSFDDGIDYAVGRSPRRVLCADFDLDGDLDLAAINSASLDASVFEGDSTGHFVSRGTFHLHGGGFAVIVDIDFDGDPDVVTQAGLSQMSILENRRGDCNGNGIADSDEIAAGFVADCDGNAIPDSCDLADALALDANNNGIPDRCERTRFFRGDVNGDGSRSVADAILALVFMFQGQTVSCADAVDVNDDGTTGLEDAISLLRWLFVGGVDIPPPLDVCGTDPTMDNLECQGSLPCL